MQVRHRGESYWLKGNVSTVQCRPSVGFPFSALNGFLAGYGYRHLGRGIYRNTADITVKRNKIVSLGRACTVRGAVLPGVQ